MIERGEDRIDPALVLGRRIAVMGYGNQGRAHSLNLRDQGVDVRVGARAGAGWDKAESDGFRPLGISEAAQWADWVVLALPDESVGEVYRREIAPFHSSSGALVFLHGFALVYGQVVPPEGVAALLVSPCGPGTAVRTEFEASRGVTALIAAEPVSALDSARAYSWAVGCSRAGLVATTFREETECDLFGEQAVLCGGLAELARAAWETLVEQGIRPEVAYLECVQQVRLLADLIAFHGIAGMFERISDTAEWGAYQTGPRVVGSESRAAMKEALARIKSGEFAREWLAEAGAGKPRLLANRAALAAAPIEATGASVRDSAPTPYPPPP
ncbi:MAG: ketol-acid reductoisomerase [Fimbriimonadaceae bacterium]|nr:ketol-acid reductoisomerase [Fimbriimonadaceae bacterium]QYK59497.1 MAG: ketol-acid reductoisomerase [Fimbriimonadaceae bacterium]